MASTPESIRPIVSENKPSHQIDVLGIFLGGAIMVLGYVYIAYTAWQVGPEGVGRVIGSVLHGVQQGMNNGN